MFRQLLQRRDRVGGGGTDHAECGDRFSNHPYIRVSRRRHKGIEHSNRLDTQVGPSANPSIYAVARKEVRRNLYMIPLR